MSGYKAREGQGDKTVIDDIVKNTKKAAAILSDIRALPADRLDKEMVLGLLVCIKLMIPEVDEPQIKNLVITGIKQQVMRAGGLSDNVIRQQIKKYDCHQTSLAAQKKTLLFMFMERELGITLEDDEAVDIETMDQLAEAFIKRLKEA